MRKWRLKTGGRAGLRFGGGRTNLLEQLGRVEAERSNPNRRAEISRVHGELNRGYATKVVEEVFTARRKLRKESLKGHRRKRIFKRKFHERDDLIRC